MSTLFHTLLHNILYIQECVHNYLYIHVIVHYIQEAVHNILYIQEVVHNNLFMQEVVHNILYIQEAVHSILYNQKVVHNILYIQAVVQLVTDLNIEGIYNLTGTGLSLLPLYGSGALNVKVKKIAFKKGKLNEVNYIKWVSSLIIII